MFSSWAKLYPFPSPVLLPPTSHSHHIFYHNFMFQQQNLTSRDTCCATNYLNTAPLNQFNRKRSSPGLKMADVLCSKACIQCQTVMLWICNDPKHINLPSIVSFFELFVPVPMNAQCSCCGRTGSFVLCHSFDFKQDSIVTHNMAIINQNKRTTHHNTILLVVLAATLAPARGLKVSTRNKEICLFFIHSSSLHSFPSTSVLLSHSTLCSSFNILFSVVFQGYFNNWFGVLHFYSMF